MISCKQQLCMCGNLMCRSPHPNRKRSPCYEQQIIKNLSVILSFILTKSKKVEHYVRIKIHFIKILG